LPRSLNEELARRRIEPDRIGRTESPGTTMAAYIPLILFTVLTNAAAQIMLKQGMLLLGTFEFTAAGIVATAPRVALNPFVILGLFTFVISMASHLLVLSRVDLSFAYPFLSLAYVVATLYAYFVFHEDVNAYRIAGIGLICLGTILISRS
jgi:drug/metabolite transporter (DMT)-like permease